MKSSFFPISILAAFLLVLAGCGPAEKPREINLFGWSEYIPQTVIDGFTRETGIRVNYETFASNEEMLSKFLGGATQYDLIQPSEYTVEALIKLNKLAPIDFNNVPNISNLAPAFRNMPFDPGQKYSVPYMAGTVGIVVNTEKIKEPVTSYRDVFQARYKDRIVALNDNRELVSWALAALGIDANDISDETLAQARPVVEKWVKLVKLFDSDSPKTALLNGEADLGVVWSGEAAILYGEDKKFRYVLPAEGAHQFVDNLAIPLGARHKAEAEAFINYILRPEVSVLISNDFPYTNPNLKARALLTQEQLRNPASYPPGDPKLDIFHDIGEASAKIDKLVTDAKSK